MAGGIFLIIAAILAMILANSPLSESYLAFIHADIGPVLTEKAGIHDAAAVGQ